jgi:hypothetical protein
VKTAFPNHQWEHEKFIGNKGSNPRQALQSLAQRIIRGLFPSMDIQSNVRSVLPSLEIDIFIPQIKLGFEYNESHHYFTSHYGKLTLLEYQEKDQRKKERMREKGITLITIPFWWDFKQERYIVAHLLVSSADCDC